MSAVLIVDASVAIKWASREDGSDEALRLLAETVTLIAPSLVLDEIGNALWRKHGQGIFSPDAAAEAFSRVAAAFAELVTDSETVLEALGVAIELGHPIYDCHYLALARLRGLTLVTADTRFLRRIAGTRHERLVVPLERWREAIPAG
jgi:predicted nucleic acid-binding protein